MRVLFVNRYSQAKNKGGVGEFLHFLPRALQQYGIEVVLYHEGASKLQGPFIMPNGATYYTGPFLRPGYFVSQKNLQPILDVCQQEKINLLHAQGTYRCGYIAMQVYKQTGIPYLVTSHADILATNSDRIKRPKIRRRCKKILESAAAVTHLTPLMADASHAIHNAQAKSFIIGNGIDVCKAKYTPGEEKDFLLTLGRLEEGKGFSILIDAFAKLLAKTHHQSSLVIAGEGSLANSLQQQAKALGLPVLVGAETLENIPPSSVIFPGYVTGDTKQTLFAEAKLVLFATQPTELAEAFGIVQLEAMAARKCLIASDSATTRYLQSLGLQAALVSANDTEEWMNKISWLLSHNEERKQMGDANALSVEQFDWNKIASQYAHLYKKLALRVYPEKVYE